MKRMLESTGEDLFVETNRDEFALRIVVVFVSRHTPPVLRGFDGLLLRFDGVIIA